MTEIWSKKAEILTALGLSAVFATVAITTQEPDPFTEDNNRELYNQMLDAAQTAGALSIAGHMAFGRVQELGPNLGDCELISKVADRIDRKTLQAKVIIAELRRHGTITDQQASLTEIYLREIRLPSDHVVDLACIHYTAV